MIDIRDLTIGNWVFDGKHTKFPMQITSLSEGYVTMSFPSNEGMDWECKPEELQGIPITEELLTKMGARKVTDIGWNVVESYSAGVRIELRVILFSESEIDVKIRRSTPHWEDYFQGSSIHYLHELQNLYWDLTKEELKIKL
jgi:hypothetical protein